jgi:hypothetical protein
VSVILYTKFIVNQRQLFSIGGSSTHQLPPPVVYAHKLHWYACTHACRRHNHKASRLRSIVLYEKSEAAGTYLLYVGEGAREGEGCLYCTYVQNAMISFALVPFRPGRSWIFPLHACREGGKGGANLSFDLHAKEGESLVYMIWSCTWKPASRVPFLRHLTMLPLASTDRTGLALHASCMRAEPSACLPSYNED